MTSGMQPNDAPSGGEERALRDLATRLDAEGRRFAEEASEGSAQRAAETSFVALRRSSTQRSNDVGDGGLARRSRGWWARGGALALAAGVALAASVSLLIWRSDAPPAPNEGEDALAHAEPGAEALAQDVAQEVDLWLAIDETPPSWRSLNAVTEGLSARSLDLDLDEDPLPWSAFETLEGLEEISS